MRNRSGQLKSPQGKLSSSQQTANNNGLQMRRNRRRNNGRKNSSGTDDNFIPPGKNANKAVCRKPRATKQAFTTEKDDYDEDNNANLTPNSSKDNNEVVKGETTVDEDAASPMLENEVNGQCLLLPKCDLDNTDGSPEMPAKPGTAITLHGVVLHETTGGLIVLNVRWRNKVYSGALIDVEKTKWAGERIEKDNNGLSLMVGLKTCPSSTKTHGKRGRRAWDTADKSADKNVTIAAEDSPSVSESSRDVATAVQAFDGGDRNITRSPDDDEDLNVTTEFSQQRSSLEVPRNGICPDAKEHEVRPGGMRHETAASQGYDQLSPSAPGLKFPMDVDGSYRTSTDNETCVALRSPGSVGSNVDGGSVVTNSSDTKIDVESNEPSTMAGIQSTAPSIVVHGCNYDDVALSATEMDAETMSSSAAPEAPVPMRLTAEQLHQLQCADMYTRTTLIPRFIADMVQLSPTLSALNPHSLNRSLTDALMPTAEDATPGDASDTTAHDAYRSQLLPAGGRAPVEEELIAASDDETYEASAVLPGMSRVTVAMEMNSFEEWREKMEMRFPTLCDSLEVAPEKKAELSLLLEQSSEEGRLLVEKLRQKAAEKHVLGTPTAPTRQEPKPKGDKHHEVTSLAHDPSLSQSFGGAMPPTDAMGSGGSLPPSPRVRGSPALVGGVPTAQSPDGVRGKTVVDGADPEPRPQDTAPLRQADNHATTKDAPLAKEVTLEPPPALSSTVGPSDSKSRMRASSPHAQPPIETMPRESSSGCPPQLVPDSKQLHHRGEGIASEGKIPSFLQPNISAGRPISGLSHKPESITGSTAFRSITRPLTDDAERAVPALSGRINEPPVSSSPSSTNYPIQHQSYPLSVDASRSPATSVDAGCTVSSAGIVSPDAAANSDRTLIAKTWVPQEIYRRGKVALLPEDVAQAEMARQNASPGRHGNASPGWRGNKPNAMDFAISAQQQNQFRVIDGRSFSAAGMHGFAVTTTDPMAFSKVPGLANHHVKGKPHVPTTSSRVTSHPVPIAPAPIPMSDRAKLERNSPMSVPMDHDAPQMSRFSFTHDKRLVPSLESRGRPRKVRVERTQQVPIGKPQDVEASRGAPPSMEPPSPHSRKQTLTPAGGNAVVRTSVIHGRGKSDGDMRDSDPGRGAPGMDAEGYGVVDKKMKLEMPEDAKHQHMPMASGPKQEQQQRPLLHTLKAHSSDAMDHRPPRSPVNARSPIDHGNRQASSPSKVGMDGRGSHPSMHPQWGRTHPFMVNPMGYPPISAAAYPPYFVGHPFQQAGPGRGSPHPPGKEQHPSSRSPVIDKKDHPLSGLDPSGMQKRPGPDVKLPPSEFFAFDPKYLPHAAHMESMRAAASPSGYVVGGFPGREHAASPGDMRTFERKQQQQRDMSPAHSSSEMMHQHARHSRAGFHSSPAPGGMSSARGGVRIDKRPDGGMGRPPEIDRGHIQPGPHQGGPHMSAAPQAMSYHDKGGPYMTSQAAQMSSGLMSNNLIFSRADGHYVGPVSYDQRQMEGKR